MMIIKYDNDNIRINEDKDDNNDVNDNYNTNNYNNNEWCLIFFCSISLA